MTSYTTILSNKAKYLGDDIWKRLKRMIQNVRDKKSLNSTHKDDKNRIVRWRINAAFVVENEFKIILMVQ